MIFDRYFDFEKKDSQWDSTIKKKKKTNDLATVVGLFCDVALMGTVAN